MLYEREVTTFTSYIIPPSDIPASYRLTDANIARLHNEITIYAEQKLALILDVNSPQSFIQQEAYLRGKIDSLKYLLDCHNSIEE